MFSYIFFLHKLLNNKQKNLPRFKQISFFLVSYKCHIKKIAHLESTTGLLEAAGEHVGGAVLLEVDLEIFAGQYGGLAAVGTGDGEATALGVMRR